MKTLVKTAAVVSALTLLATACFAAPDAVPTLKSAWKLNLPAGTKRIGIADVTGDKKLRLLTLDADGGLTVNKLSDSDPNKEITLTKEATIALGKQIDEFVVGQFVKDKPAVVVVPGAMFYRDGDTYTRKDAPKIKNVSGMVRFADGAEKIIDFGGHASPQAYSLDLAADDPIKESSDLPSPDGKPELFRDIAPFLPVEMLEQAPFPMELKKGGIIRLFTPKDSKKLYGLISWQAETSHLALVDGSDIFPMPKSDMKPLWKSEKLAGKILDIVLATSIKDGKQSGVYVLEATGDDGKGRQLEFFARD